MEHYRLFLCLLLLPLPTIIHSNFILTSPPVTNFGGWGTWQNCDDGTFLRGLNVVVNKVNDPYTPPPIPTGPDNDDNKGIIDLSLIPDTEWCVDPYETTFPPTPDPDFTCEGLVTGFQLKNQIAQIALDNYGATSIRLYCSGLKGSPTGYIETINSDSLGSWTEPQFCNTRQAVCGLRIQIDPAPQQPGGNEDETGINNVQFRCCDIPPPTKNCIATEGWELVQECDNVKGTSQISCRSRRHVGVGVLTALTPDGFKSKDIYKHISYGYDALDKTNPPFWAYDELSEGFATTIGFSNVTGFDWTEPNYEIWNPIRASDSDHDVKEGLRSLVFQVVGTCGYFNIRTNYFRKVDVTRSNTCRGLECLDS